MKPFWSGIKKSFLTGVFLVLPLVVTLYILYKGFDLLTALSKPLVNRAFVRFGIEVPTVAIGLVAFALTVALLILLGAVGRSYFGKKALWLVEVLLTRVPFAKTIYTSTQRLLDALSLKRDFQGVVLVEFTRKGCWTLGFSTTPHRGALSQTSGRDYVNVFVPTTPNPTSGYLIIVPKEEVIPMDMTVEEGITFVISGGIVSTPLLPKAGGAA